MRRSLVKNTRIAALGCGLVLAANLAQAAIFDRNGNKIPDAEVNSTNVNWKLLSVEQARKYNGIGLLTQRGQGICTAFLLDTSAGDKVPAYALTNGHCYNGMDFPDSQEILINKPSNLVFKLNYFKDGVNHVRPVQVKKVVYATMKGTDITILELATSFQQLVREGFTPLKIDKLPAPVGEPVEIIGIPITGVEPSRSFLHRSVCEVGNSVNVREDVYQWQKSIRHRCSLVGGMSGSPVVSLKSNRVVAIANTGVNDSALSEPECSLNRPCEISNNGKVTTFFLENYAQPINAIPSCFDHKGLFNLNLLSCQLEKPQKL